MTILFCFCADQFLVTFDSTLRKLICPLTDSESQMSYSSFIHKCDLGDIDDIWYLVLQCLRFHVERREIFDEISNIPDVSGRVFLDSPDDLLYIYCWEKV